MHCVASAGQRSQTLERLQETPNQSTSKCLKRESPTSDASNQQYKQTPFICKQLGEFKSNESMGVHTTRINLCYKDMLSMGA